MEENNREKKPQHKSHVLLLPYPSQGHINPMLEFSKRLAFKGLKATLVTTIFISNSMKLPVGEIEIEAISDGFDNGGFAEANSIDAYLTRLEIVGSQSLNELLKKLKNSGYPVNCIVYDSFLPWALKVAKNNGLFGASFFTQACSVNNIYYHAHHGLLKEPVLGPVSLPGMPPLEVEDLPSFLYVSGSYPAYFEMVKNQFSNADEADLIFVNTFDKLEEEAVAWMKKLFPLKTIGPTIPSIYLDKRIENDNDYGFNLFKLDDDPYINWLDSKPFGSVIYVSFGSMASLEEKQMEELAWALKESNKYFFWIVRESERKKLPNNFFEETLDKGLMVTWCAQLEVLAHKAIGCFLTHCGWNSTLEALSLGVPMVGMPQWTDQTTDAKFVEDVWRVGLRAKVDEKGIIRREEIKMCLNEVMEGEKGKEIKENARKWKELAKKAVEQGGSTDKNIDEFVSRLITPQG